MSITSTRHEQWTNQFMDPYCKYLSSIMCYRNITEDQRIRDLLVDLHDDETRLSDLDVRLSSASWKNRCTFFFPQTRSNCQYFRIDVANNDLDKKMLGVSIPRTRYVTDKTGNCRSKVQKDFQRNKKAIWNSKRKSFKSPRFVGSFSHEHDSAIILKSTDYFNFIL